MTLPASISQRLRLPLIAAPMLLVSGPDLVIESCRAGVIGSFPTKNCRTVDELDRWLARMQEETEGGAPYAPNLIVHKTNTRLHEDMKLVEKYAPALVITSVGSPAPVMDTIHAAGGLVFADVASMRHVERALQVGVDGLILLTAGAGGQTGWANPLAFVRAVRSVFDGPVVLAGGVADGVALRAAIVLGCDLAYMGTRFIATKQSLAAPGLQGHAGVVVARRHRVVARAHRSRNESAAPLRRTGRHGCQRRRIARRRRGGHIGECAQALEGRLVRRPYGGAGARRSRRGRPRRSRRSGIRGGNPLTGGASC